MGQGNKEGHQYHDTGLCWDGLASEEHLGGTGGGWVHTPMPTPMPMAGQPRAMALCQAGTTNVGLRCLHGPAGRRAAHETEITELFPLTYVKTPLAARSPKEGGVPSKWMLYKMLAVKPGPAAISRCAEEVGAGLAPRQGELSLPVPATLPISLLESGVLQDRQGTRVCGQNRQQRSPPSAPPLKGYRHLPPPRIGKDPGPSGVSKQSRGKGESHLRPPATPPLGDTETPEPRRLPWGWCGP